MKVRELLKELQNMDIETEVQVLIADPKRGYSGTLNPVQRVSSTINQDSNKVICTLEIEKGE